jgi:hypothetical protein
MIAHMAPTIHSPTHSTRLVTWLRSRQCHRGYFNAGAPGPQPFPACAGSRLQHVTLWDLTHEAELAEMLRHGEG